MGKSFLQFHQIKYDLYLLNINDTQSIYNKYYE